MFHEGWLSSLRPLMIGFFIRGLLLAFRPPPPIRPATPTQDTYFFLTTDKFSKTSFFVFVVGNITILNSKYPIHNASR
jgi:hypothetical protein